MIRKKPEKRISLFWLANILGWIIFHIIHLINYHTGWTNSNNLLLLIIFNDIMGFIFTILLRYVYKHAKYQTYSFFRLAIFVIIGSIVTSNIWVLTVLFAVLKIPFFELQVLIKNNISFMAYWKELWPKLYTMFFWSTLYFITKLWLDWREQKNKTEKAVLLAQNAQLQMLRQQVDPHFLFNTLSSLRTLVRKNQKKADEMILKISDFLRYSLETKKDNQVPLSKELEVIGHYLDIERVRFSEDLQVHYDISTKANDFIVPSFIIHPLIENAIKYGMNTSTLPLKITLRANVVNNILNFEITNSGHWDDSSKTKHKSGLGMDNVMKRLELANPDNKLLIKKNDDVVQITLLIKI